jgi:hypothetical protein
MVEDMISGNGEGQHGASEFTAETAGAVLREACAGAGLDATGAEMVRLGSNAVYRLTSSPAIVRIARDHDALADMQRVVQVARWLETEDFPATRVLAGVAQPSLVAGRVVTFWESAQDGEEYATVGGRICSAGCTGGSVLVLVEGSAEPISSVDVQGCDLSWIAGWFGQGAEVLIATQHEHVAA